MTSKFIFAKPMEEKLRPASDSALDLMSSIRACNATIDELHEWQLDLTEALCRVAGQHLLRAACPSAPPVDEGREENQQAPEGDTESDVTTP